MSGEPGGAEQLDGVDAEALSSLVLTLADSKRLMGIRYSDWLLGAPSIETGIATSAMAQDEWGHARLLYAMLKHFGVDPLSVEHDRPGEEYASMAALDEPAPDWAALVAMMVVVDGALTVMLRSFADGAFEPARSRVPKMVAEEEFHTSLGHAWYRRLAASSEEARTLLTRATEAMLPRVLAWVGADDAGARALAESGVVGSAPERIASLRAVLRDPLSQAGLDVDAYPPASEWDGARWRAPGRPDEDSVTRARGDRNRALFVE